MDGILLAAILVLIVVWGIFVWQRDDVFTDAVSAGDLAKVKRLLSEKPRRIQDRDALFYAIVNDHREVVAFLLQAGADPTAGLEGDNAALHVAAKYATIETIDVILKHGNNIDSEGIGKQTPLYWAAAMGRADNVKFLLSRGADPQRVDLATLKFNGKVTTPQAYQEAKAMIKEARQAPCAGTPQPIR